VAIREYNAATGRTDIHVFDQWCHLTTVHDAAELEEAMCVQRALAFDLDTYRMLVKRLTKPMGLDPSVFHLPEAALG
jgi:DNA polymerase-3 subunit epsilon